MKEFFEAMDATQQFYWFVAIGASVIFVIQSIMTFIGSDADTGVDADFDGNLDGSGAPFQLFSLRNLINFLLGFGWTGAALYSVISNGFLLGMLSFIVGVIFIAVFFLIMRALMKLSEDNSFNIEDVVGKSGDVYMNIPASKTGKGKVFVSVKGSTHELPAMTSTDRELKSGEVVKILKLEGDILLVTPMSE